MKSWWAIAPLLSLLWVLPGHAQTTGAKPSAATSGSASLSRPAPKVWSSCSEHIPKGATRPKVNTHMPNRGLSGHVVRLTVVITHGAGETVLPDGFRLQRASDAAAAVQEAGFVFPESAGSEKATIDRAASAVGKDALLTSSLSIPFVPLPAKPGRHRLTLPPVPVAIARASGEVMTVCTAPRIITVEDPIANKVDPKVKGNPPPRPQREQWQLAKQLAIGGLAVLVLALILTWLIRRWMNRPRPVPQKDPVLPWVAAMAELAEIRSSRLLKESRYDEFVDLVSECVRRYLGARYGFDGVESTTQEIHLWLGRVYPPPPQLEKVFAFLDETDFVKFTNVSPGADDCEKAITSAVEIVNATIPPKVSRAATDGKPSAGRAA